MEEDDKFLAIDEAIAQCDALAKHHNGRATNLLAMVVIAFLLTLLLGFFFVFQNTVIRDKPMSDTFAYLLFGSFVTVFAVLMATHRFHLSEASRMNHIRLGFMRVRVAGRNTKPAWQGEVRHALTDGAFPNIEASRSFGLGQGKSKVENPLPGHPGLDLSAQILNKVLEKLDISVKAKSDA
jgi:hypothetical protein